MLRKIVTGGQTGADRAAMDVALKIGLQLGGWVPLGRTDELGTVPARYPNLVEADSDDPAVRTSLNVRDSDATLILAHGAPTGGTKLTLECARALGRPDLQLDLAQVESDAIAAERIRSWLRARPNIATLNVAGPRQSEDPHIYGRVREILLTALRADTG